MTWDSVHGIEMRDGTGPAPFDLFTLLKLCWLWLRVEHIRVEIERACRRLG